MRRTARRGRCTESRSEGLGGGRDRASSSPRLPLLHVPAPRQEAAGEPRPPRGHPAEVGLPASRVLLGGRVGTSGRLPRRPARPRERRGTGCRDGAARGHLPCSGRGARPPDGFRVQRNPRVPLASRKPRAASSRAWPCSAARRNHTTTQQRRSPVTAPASVLRTARRSSVCAAASPAASSRSAARGSSVTSVSGGSDRGGSAVAGSAGAVAITVTDAPVGNVRVR